MALADAAVRRTTATATTAARDTSLSRSAAAQAGRAVLAHLPGFRTGDALASAILTAAAPDRMAWDGYSPARRRWLSLCGALIGWCQGCLRGAAPAHPGRRSR